MRVADTVRGRLVPVVWLVPAFLRPDGVGSVRDAAEPIPPKTLRGSSASASEPSGQMVARSGLVGLRGMERVLLGVATGGLLAVGRPRPGTADTFRGNRRLEALGTIGHDTRGEAPK